MRSNLDKGSPLNRALGTLSDGDKVRLAQGDLLDGRVGHRRDLTLESRRSALYEEVRLLTKEQLFERAGVRPGPGWSKAELVTMILQAEVPQ